MGKNLWVSPCENGKWRLHWEKSKQDIGLYNTKREAAENGRIIAKNNKEVIELIIQRKDGRIHSKDTYGKDPCPPKDKEH